MSAHRLTIKAQANMGDDRPVTRLLDALVEGGEVFPCRWSVFTRNTVIMTCILIRFSALLLSSTVFVACAGSIPGLPLPNGIPGLPADLNNSLKQALPGQPAAIAGAAAATHLVRGQIAPAEGIPSFVPEYVHDIERDKKLEIDDVLEDDVDGSSAALARLERGRLAHMQGDFSTSIDEFEEAIDLARDFEDRATISLSAMSDQVASLVVNDTVIDYEPAGFERVMMYHFQALNHLAKGDLEAAGVEVRRANDEQERALKAHEKEIAEAREGAASKGISLSDFSSDISKALGKSGAVGNEVKNSFQNAYTFYMSAVVHELMGEPNDAYIDYKKALEIAPKNGFIQRDVARLATRLEMTDDIGRYSRQYPQAFASVAKVSSGDVDLVVLFEDGLVPARQAIKLPLPVPGVIGLTAFAIPTYQVSLAPAQPLTVRGAGRDFGKTERICAIDSLAVKDYQEKAPAMLARQVLRTALKGGATAAAGHYGGTLGSLATSTYTVMTEKADTRSWQSLPQNAQLLRARVGAGVVVDLVHPSTGARGSVAVPDGSKNVVVRAIRVGSKLVVTSASF